MLPYIASQTGSIVHYNMSLAPDQKWLSMSRQLILASQSAQRKIMLETLGISFMVVPADLDEKLITAPDLKLRAAAVAQAKADLVQQRFPTAIIIAADTYPEFDGKAIEKPLDLIEAAEMLTVLSGQTFAVHTGFCYLDSLHKITHTMTVTTMTTLRSLSATEIQAYVSRYPVTTWSAAFCPAYPHGESLVASIDGSLAGFTHGLPIEEVVPLLEQSHLL